MSLSSVLIILMLNVLIDWFDDIVWCVTEMGNFITASSHKEAITMMIMIIALPDDYTKKER